MSLPLPFAGQAQNPLILEGVQAFCQIGASLNWLNKVLIQNKLNDNFRSSRGAEHGG
jgi:hypothetical protein